MVLSPEVEGTMRASLAGRKAVGALRDSLADLRAPGLPPRLNGRRTWFGNWSPGNHGIVPFSAGRPASCTLLLLLQGVSISARKACASSMCADESEGVGSRLLALHLTPRINVSAASAASEAWRRSRVSRKLPVDFGRKRPPLLPLTDAHVAGCEGDRTESKESLNGGLKRDHEESLSAVGGGKSLGEGGLVLSAGSCSDAESRTPPARKLPTS